MIWEQQCLLIVMTTRVMERGRIKCGQYWEPCDDSVCQFGDYQVRTFSVDSNDDYTVASLQLRNVKVSLDIWWSVRFSKKFFFRLMKLEVCHIGSLRVGRIMVYQVQRWLC